MHFLLGLFVALVTLATGVLFTEVFPKWIKHIMTLIGAISSGYAISILIRKISEMSGLFEQPALYSTALIAGAIMLVVIIVTKIVLNKKKA